MLRRAELVEQTRHRIVEAAIKLHTTVGPAGTTISALAEEAGVTRLTVYRHFATREDLVRMVRRRGVEELEELAQSIREHGVLQPVLVSQQPDGACH